MHDPYIFSHALPCPAPGLPAPCPFVVGPQLLYFVFLFFNTHGLYSTHSSYTHTALASLLCLPVLLWTHILPSTPTELHYLDLNTNKLLSTHHNLYTLHSCRGRAWCVPGYRSRP
jgi:hypothetical protein